MALQVRRAPSIRVRIIATLMMTFAVVAQPLYGFVSAQIANAAVVADHVVINEIMADSVAGEKEWIELYNPTETTIDLSQWRITDGSGNFTGVFEAGTIIAAKSFIVRMSQNSASQLHDVTKELRLESDNKKTLVDTATYRGIIEGKSYARTYDAADTWVAQATPTRGLSNGSAPVVAPAKTPIIAAENFNTNSDSAYDGISVGFNVKNFSDVKSVTVKLVRADNSVVTKTAGPAVLNIINDDGTETLSTPFIIKAGAFTEANDVDSQGRLYWNPASAAGWTSSTRPTNAIVEVINGDSTIHTLDFNAAGKSFTEPDAVAYQSITPALPPVQASETIRANTAAAENQLGWMFGRDTNNATPYAFTGAKASIGSGSLFVSPIDSTPASKMIAEYFGQVKIADLKSFSYDYQIAGNGTSADSDDFYVNVYANIDNSPTYFDCRYDYVSSGGSTANFTTSGFDATSTPTSVTKRSTARLDVCPATLAGMPAGSYVRAFAINVGQTSDSDKGLAGYLDNVIVSTKSTVTTYDFEADISAPSTPTNGAPHTTYERDNDFYFTWSKSTDDLSAVTYEFQSSATSNADSNGSLVGSWNSKRDGNAEQNNLTTPTIHSTGAPDGKYYWQVRAVDAAGNASAWSPVWSMTIDSNAPSAPNNLGLKVTATGVAIPANSFTNKAGVTATWAGNNAEQVSYVYKYWNDVTSSVYTENNQWPHPLADMSYAGVVNEGEGKHFFCVVAKDLAGNESACSAAYGFTYDATAPDATTAGIVDGQKVTDDVTLQGLASDKNPMNSYFIITGPNNYSKSSFYGDGRALHEYIWETGSLANGTYKVQFETRDKAGNKDGGSVTSVSVVVNNPQPVVVGENFNTHSGADYKGINVGFNIANFKTVTGVSVALYDVDDNLLATNTHNDKLLDLIKSGTMQLSTPFIATPGTYVEEFWNLGTPTWSRSSVPAKVVVTVTGTNSANATVTSPATLTQLVEANDVTFVDTLPLVVIVPVVPPAEDDPDDSSTVIDNGTLPLIINQLATASPLPGINGVTAGSTLANSFTSSDDQSAASDEETAAVLGAQTTNESGDVSDIAKNVAVIEPSAEGWKFFGLAWYWLALLIAAIATIWYAVARRRNQDA